MQKNDEVSLSATDNASSALAAFHVIVLGSGGGPDEDNVTGLLLRSTATKWSRGSLLAVDAGVHLAAIIRILEKHPPELPPQPPARPLFVPECLSAPSESKGKAVSSPPISPTTSVIIDPMNAQDGAATRKSSESMRASRLKTKITNGPFTDLDVPFGNAKANAAYITRELVETYLITHPHLDHLSGFTINTASFQHTSRPKRIAALPHTIEAIKTHIFNDIIWPNLSDEEGGVGLVTYMRLVEGGNLALGEGNGRGYIEVCEGLTVKSWGISHGHCMKKHSHRGSMYDSQQIEGSPSGSRRVSRASLTPDFAVSSRSTPFLPHPSEECVTESSAFFIRDEDTGSEILVFGDVEPDSISLSPRTARLWEDAAPKIAATVLKAIFIECSYDDSQPDDTLFGHLCPRHLMAELHNLAEKVVAITTGRKRKRLSSGMKISEDAEATARRSFNPHWPSRLNRESNSGPMSRFGDETLPGLIRDSEDPLLMSFGEAAPLRDLNVFIIHMKDTLHDGPDVGSTILSQLQEHEKKIGLGCNFTITHPGQSVWL